MKELAKEYTVLFNGITDALHDLELVQQRLQWLQQMAEKFYVEHDEKPELILLAESKKKEIS